MCSIPTPRRDRRRAFSEDLPVDRFDPADEMQAIAHLAEIARSIRIRDALREADRMRWILDSLEAHGCFAPCPGIGTRFPRSVVFVGR